MEFDIKEIRSLLKEDKIQWSGHILTRMQQRGIKVKEVIECILSGEIIEYYSEDYPYSSCLILGFSENAKGIHLVCSIGEDNLWMITAYCPDSEEWMEDLKTRRR